MNHISTQELDSIARLGLDDLRACFTSNPPTGTVDRAELTLKILRQGTSRMSGENNRLAIALKVAKAAGVPQEDQKLLWKQIAGTVASDGTQAETPQSLAPSESTGSGETSGSTSSQQAEIESRSQSTAKSQR